MHARLVILIAFAAMVASLSPIVAHAAPPGEVAFAQETDSGEGGTDTDTESGGTETEGGSDEGGEAEGGGAEGEAADETGPPWTYQMARISLVLLALTLAGVFFAYYKFVVIRRREGF
ncbi:MAG: hypothetical protein H0U17_01455 [Actinobacteria bacterium]|jgi:hypothetical protein|nr:hypothetical protein [Actinomycetota bacterium]